MAPADVKMLSPGPSHHLKYMGCGSPVMKRASGVSSSPGKIMTGATEGQTSAIASISPKQTSGSRSISHHPHVGTVVKAGDGNYRDKFVSVAHFKKGDVICKIKDVSLAQEKRYTSVQYGPNRHLELNSDLVYMNHSCSPSVSMDVGQMHVCAVKDISPGEDLTFFYPSTEWEMDQPFACWCGSNQCLGVIAGAKYIPCSQLSRYFVNEHIRELMMDATKAKDVK